SGIKDRTTIIDELKVQNKNNREFLAWLESAQASLEHIDIILSKDSKALPQGKAIENWSKKEIFTWTRSVKRSSKPIYQEELVAVANQAVRLHKGYSPRDTQLLSVLALLNKKSGYGRLIQVKTGEGKTTIAGMTSVIAALQTKKPIDIVTSSSVLAKRDSAEQAPYYSLFGLSCRHINKSESTGAKECYLADILYGSASDFEGDYLRDIFKGQGTRIGREFSTVIVDEVDSMLVDEGAKITKLTTPRPGAEYLAPIFILTWKAIEDLNITEEMLSNSEIKENLERRIEEHIDIILSSGHFVYPNYLQDYIYSQVGEWSKSALLASYIQEDVHYVINYDEDSKSKVISPVDYVNSGVIQSKTTWGNGVHQFLQLKHSLKMTSDSITTSFMSNMSFFLKYGSNIMGMTGTLGSDRSKDLLSDTYNLDTAVIPKFKTNLFIEQEGVVVIDESEHKNTIIDSAINEASRGRVILIIAKTIVFAKDLAKALAEVYSISKIHTYTHNEDSEAVEDIKQAGDIIVATNLAGRGTDIKLSEETIANGGLH
ncbi:MAG: helicase-related protein, partial [Pseudomonadota bacterium]